MGLFLRQASMKSRLAPSGSATTPPVRPTNLLEGTLLWPLCKGVRPAGGRRHLHSRSAKAPKVCGLRPPRRVFEHSWLLLAQSNLFSVAPELRVLCEGAKDVVVGAAYQEPSY